MCVYILLELMDQQFCIIICLIYPDNKRLDEWVPAERMDLSKLEQPKKDVKTPVKKEPGVSNAPVSGRVVNGGSRPASPEPVVSMSSCLTNKSIYIVRKSCCLASSDSDTFHHYFIYFI